MPDKKRNIIVRIVNYFWSIFLNGLLTILPLTLTIAIFSISFRLLVDWLEPVRKFKPALLNSIPHAELLIVIALILLIGTILKIFVLRSIIHTLEQGIERIPLIRPLYSGIKQLVQAFSMQDKISFKKVVLVEFPRRGLYSIGFLTSEMPHSIAPNPNERFYNVFIPTTPNPTSGYFIVAPEKEISVVDLTRQEAMALIISGGIIQPERLLDEEEKHTTH